MVSILLLGAIPVTTGLWISVDQQKHAGKKKKSRSDALMRKFTLAAFCDDASSSLSSSSSNTTAAKQVHNGRVVLLDGKVYVQTPSPSPSDREADERNPVHAFEGFYVTYPPPGDPPPPKPHPLGLVSTVASGTLNWIYIDRDTAEVKHGNRSSSWGHRVGDWGATAILDDEGEVEGEWKSKRREPGQKKKKKVEKTRVKEEEEEVKAEEEEPGGLLFEKEELFVLVQPRRGERADLWEVRWDRAEDLLGGGVGGQGREVLAVSLERVWVDDVPGEGVGAAAAGS